MPGSAEYRYMNDPEFNRLVNIMEQFINTNQFTPSEMREAAVLASIHHEIHRVRRNCIQLTPELHEQLIAFNQIVSEEKG